MIVAESPESAQNGRAGKIEIIESNRKNSIRLESVTRIESCGSWSDPPALKFLGLQTQKRLLEKPTRGRHAAPPCFCPLGPCQDRKKRLQATKLTDMDKQVNARLFINFLSNRIFFDFFGIVSVSWANPASVAHLLPAGRAVTFLNPSTKVCKFSYWILIPKILKWLDSSCWAIVSNPIESNYSIIYRIEFFDFLSNRIFDFFFYRIE